jgi:hypothetical protein
MEVIIKDRKEEAVINWDNVQLVESIMDSMLILTSGIDKGDTFYGTELGGNNHGKYSGGWRKSNFKLSNKEVSISNK